MSNTGQPGPDFSQFATQNQGAQPPAPPAQSTPPVGDQQPPAQTQPQEPELSDYARGVLEKIPEAERGIVQKYLPQWEAGVNRRIGQLEQVYRPFEQFVQGGLGVADLETATLLYDLVTSDPQSAVELINRMHSGQALGQPRGQSQSQPQGQPQGQPQFGQQYGQQYGQQQQAQLPPELAQQMTRMDQFMQQMALSQQQQKQADIEAEQDQALNDYMKNLRTEKGTDFDENWVLDRMAEGMDGAEAVDAFSSMIQQHVQSAQQQPGGGNVTRLPAPPVVNGGSAMPAQRSVVDYSSQEVRDTIKQILNQANAS